MPSTAPYQPTHSFNDDPAPTGLVSTAQLDTQLRLIAQNIGDLMTALGVSIRDDNTLSDLLVRVRNLHPELSTYIQSAITGTIATQALSFKLPVRATAPANVPSRIGPQTIDGVVLIAGDRVLLQAQTDPKENGLWVVTAALVPWTRATDLPAGLASGSGWGVMVREGTTLKETIWVVLAGGDPIDQPVVNTDDLDLFQVFGPWPLPVAQGGTGAITAAGARANLGIPVKSSTLITGTGSQVVWSINHGLGTADMTGAAIDVLSGDVVGLSILNISTSTAQVVFSVAPAFGKQFRIVLIG